MPIYSPWVAGEIVTATKLNDKSPVVIIKGADQTVTNSSVLTNCTTMAFSVVANAQYILHAKLIYSATSSASGGRDIKFAWTAPAGTTMERGTMGIQDTDEGTGGGVGVARTVYMRNRSLGTEQYIGGTGAPDYNMYLEFSYVTVGAVAGTVQLQFAQLVAGASTTATVRAPSTLWYQRIA